MFFEYQRDKFVNLEHVAKIKIAGDEEKKNRWYTFYDANGKSLAKTDPGSSNNDEAAKLLSRLIAG